MNRTSSHNETGKLAVKIFGERNVGTNYLEQLVRANYDVELLSGVRSLTARQIRLKTFFLFGTPRHLYAEYLIDEDIHKLAPRNLGWKHSAPNAAQLGTALDIARHRFIFLLKNPYAFIESLHRTPYHALDRAKSGMDEFIRSEWRLVERDNLPYFRLSSPVQLWNLKVRAYFDFMQAVPACRMFRYEDILSDMNGFFDRMDEFLGQKAPRTNIQRSTKSDKAANFQTYAAKYVNYDPVARLGKENVAAINGLLDEELVRRAGYEIARPPG